MKIAICDNCNGTGEIPKNRIISGEDIQDFTCDKCKGSGRMATKQYTIEMPYSEDMHNFIILDEKITETIRNWSIK